MRERRRDERGRRTVFREVAGNGVRVAELECERLEPLGAAGRQHHACAGRVEHPGEAGAEAGARAGDDRDLAVEAESGERVEHHDREATERAVGRLSGARDFTT